MSKQLPNTREEAEIKHKKQKAHMQQLGYINY